MKDKEMIEEIAKDKQWQRRDNYCLRIQKALQYKGTADNEDVPSILVDFENEIRKEISKDSVVLSREEYEKLLKIKEQSSIKETNYFSNLFKLQKELEQVEKERDSAIDNCDRKSKETAEKIDDFLCENDLLGGWGIQAYRQFIKEQFGVEIKE